MLKQIIQGIKDHNDKGFMHRDLKLSNIGLKFMNVDRFDDEESAKKFATDFSFSKNRSNVKIKILDYGLAKQIPADN